MKLFISSAVRLRRFFPQKVRVVRKNNFLSLTARELLHYPLVRIERSRAVQMYPQLPELPDPFWRSRILIRAPGQT